MVRTYYFSEAADGSDLIAGDEGMQLENDEAARLEAIVALREMAAHSPPDRLTHGLTVFDGHRTPVLRVLNEIKIVKYTTL